MTVHSVERLTVVEGAIAINSGGEAGEEESHEGGDDHNGTHDCGLMVLSVCCDIEGKWWKSGVCLSLEEVVGVVVLEKDVGEAEGL